MMKAQPQNDKNSGLKRYLQRIKTPDQLTFWFKFDPTAQQTILHKWTHITKDWYAFWTHKDEPVLVKPGYYIRETAHGIERRFSEPPNLEEYD